MLLDSEIAAIAQQVVDGICERQNNLLTVEDVSKKLGKSPEAIKKLCQRGRLPYHKHYGTLYFSSAELKSFLLEKSN